MSITKILEQYYSTPNPYKKQRDISNEIKLINRETDYIKKYNKRPPERLTTEKMVSQIEAAKQAQSQNNTTNFLKKLNII